MKIYIARHGDAVSKSANPERPLSDHGREEISAMANYLDRLDIRIENVFHSGKLRAAETAEIYADAVAPKARLKVLPGLKPNDDPAEAAAFLRKLDRNTLVAGHMPNLGLLIHVLTDDSPSRPPMWLETGGIVTLSRYDERGWAITAQADPNKIRKN